MKKFLSILLCLLMIVPCFAFVALAEEETEEEVSNVALDAGIKASSYWNASTLPKSATNGVTKNDIGGGHNNYWRPSYPGRDTWTGGTPGEASFQLTFKGKNRGYKLLEGVDIWVKFNAEGCKACDPQYTVQALINGVWTTVGTGLESSATPVEGKETAGILHIDFPETVTVDGTVCQVNAKALRFLIDNFAATGCGAGWHCPIIYEFEVWGKTGFIPEIDLHDGALLSTNAALSGHRDASSSMNNQYPYLGADNYDSFWASKATTDGEWFEVLFDKGYDLEKLELNFGSIIIEAGSNETFTYTISTAVLVDGVWKDLGEQDVTTSTGKANNVEVALGTNNIEVEGVKVTFVSTGGAQAAINEVIATIADGKKCEFLAEYLTTYRRQSAANGNLAIYGEPYAYSVMDHLGISDLSYINDGGIATSDFAWYSKGFEMGQYCGVTLEEESKVNKVVLYFNDGIIGQYNARDYFVFGFDVQAKIDGEFVTVAKGTSYNAAKEEYIVSIEFEEVEATDIRIAFTDIDIGFTYIKELEVYGSTRYNDFSTYAHGRKNVAKTTSFGDAFVIGRANFSVLANPLRTMLTINDIRASLWI
jgi:hypothetical protein